jgi:hypothetical protein
VCVCNISLGLIRSKASKIADGHKTEVIEQLYHLLAAAVIRSVNLLAQKQTDFGDWLGSYFTITEGEKSQLSSTLANNGRENLITTLTGSEKELQILKYTPHNQNNQLKPQHRYFCNKN